MILLQLDLHLKLLLCKADKIIDKITPLSEGQKLGAKAASEQILGAGRDKIIEKNDN
jgi:hypothetical protein